MKKILLLLALLISAPVVNAEIPATPLPTDTRLVVFTYDVNNSFEIIMRPRSVTNIQLGPDERIKALALGDTIQWEWSKTSDGQHLFIKPKFEKIDTSATLVTNKRTYQLIFKSTTLDGRWYQRVTWEYPDVMTLEEIAAEKTASDQESLSTAKLSPGTAVENLNFDYTIDGSAPFKPVTVIDDGQFTFLRMPPKLKELPAVLMLTNDDDKELINYIIRGDYIVVQRLVDRLLLKIGKQEVIVTKKDSSKRTFFDMFKSK